jgi:hypothetical protein
LYHINPNGDNTVLVRGCASEFFPVKNHSFLSDVI